jgi:hypothetical protein
MSTLDEPQSLELAQRIKSKANQSFDNAYRAALATKGAVYIQGFLGFTGEAKEPIEHAWIEVEERIIDPTFPHLRKKAERLYYFPAQRLSVRQLTAAVEEAKEDYPEDPALPIYGKTPYEYYGNVMLGGQEYLKAYEAAIALYQEWSGTEPNA